MLAIVCFCVLRRKKRKTETGKASTRKSAVLSSNISHKASTVSSLISANPSKDDHSIATKSYNDPNEKNNKEISPLGYLPGNACNVSEARIDLSARQLAESIVDPQLLRRSLSINYYSPKRIIVSSSALDKNSPYDLAVRSAGTFHRRNVDTIPRNIVPNNNSSAFFTKQLTGSLHSLSCSLNKPFSARCDSESKLRRNNLSSCDSLHTMQLRLTPG